MKLFQQLSMSLSHIQNKPPWQVIVAVNGETQELEGFERWVRDEVFDPPADVVSFSTYVGSDRQTLEL